MLFSFSQLNQDINCFSFPSYIVFLFSSRNRFIIYFPKRSRRNSIPINTLYRGVDYYYYYYFETVECFKKKERVERLIIVMYGLIKTCQIGFLYYFAYQPSVFVEFRFRGKVIVIVCYGFCFYTPTLQILILTDVVQACGSRICNTQLLQLLHEI